MRNSSKIPAAVTAATRAGGPLSSHATTPSAARTHHTNASFKVTDDHRIIDGSSAMTTPAAIAHRTRTTRNPTTVVSAAALAPAAAVMSCPGSAADPSHARAVSGHRKVAGRAVDRVVVVRPPRRVVGRHLGGEPLEVLVVGEERAVVEDEHAESDDRARLQREQEHEQDGMIDRPAPEACATVAFTGARTPDDLVARSRRRRRTPGRRREGR